MSEITDALTKSKTEGNLAELRDACGDEIALRFMRQSGADEQQLKDAKAFFARTT